MAEATSISVSRTIDAPAKDIFDVLSNPERHREFDGSGQIVSDDRTNRIQAVGDVFTMNMNAPHMGGDYKTENHVTGFGQDKILAWQTAPAGQEPAGWEWVWELDSTGPDSTDVTLTYDWSKVDAATAKKVSFPLIPREALEESLKMLAGAVSGA
ncbi:SRPBCC family protein [Brevibacterium sp. BRM-1]|uniref:SRPBCC family protein n=1 Tax=Brevibacterium sp. BRM-1 TaxID=2999062 RepID=UPI00227DB3B5|nr:SRPBCC family protein [Brevibacterium sp. BRM-1]WAL39233.1 SRPBCC family protein [Brevibacterium sp. BRM-1]